MFSGFSNIHKLYVIITGIKVRIKFGSDKKYVYSMYMKDPSEIHAKYIILTKSGNH